MTPLPFNLVLPKALRANIQFALGALPIGLALGAFWPFWLLGQWFAAVLGIPIDAPVRDQQNGWLWAAVILLGLLCLLAAGYFVGWLLNALVARYILGWPSARVRAVFLRSEIPAHWYRTPSTTGKATDPEFGTEAGWAHLRAKGAWHFILDRGIFRFGGFMFVMLAVAPVLANARPTYPGYWLVNGLVCTFVGALFGGVIWYLSEKQYRKGTREEGERH